MRDVPSGIEFVEGLLGWIHDRPEMYCMYAGELDSVLHFLHLAWAKVQCRDQEFDVARMEASPDVAGRLSPEERMRAVDLNDYATQRVLEFWARIDTALGVKRYE